MSETVACPMAGQVWRHRKSGRLYMVLAVSDYTGDYGCVRAVGVVGFPEGEKLVTYIGLYDNPHGNRPCTRSLVEWTEPVAVPYMVEGVECGTQCVSRFVKVSI